MILFHDTDRPASLHEREGLHSYLRSNIPKPELLTAGQYCALSTTERERYDRARVLYLSGGILVNTATLARAKRDVKLMMAENIGANSGNTGLMLSGDSTLGKTTISKALMKFVFTQYGKLDPDFEAHSRVPVVYIEVPADCTAKNLMLTFARFFGMTVTRSETAEGIKYRVVQALRASRTQLVVVDELHNLSATNRGNGESVSVLKLLHDEVPATFIYAGINLSDGALLAGLKGQQLSGRFVKTDLARYNLADPDQAKDWRGIIASFEHSLPLHDHTPGTLIKLNSYLWERTSGSIGSLGRLLTGAAIRLIIDPDGSPEALTRDLLDDHRIDMAAESAYNRRRIAKTSTTRKTNTKDTK